MEGLTSGRVLWILLISLSNHFLTTSAKGGKHNCIKSAFEEHGLVPGLLDEAPREVLKIRYPGDVDVKLGNVLTPTQTFEAPLYVHYRAENRAFYTLIMTDPDAPGESSEFKHWLVMNIPGTQLERGDVLSAYLGAGPPNGTGLHRYLFLLYRQPNCLDLSSEARLDNGTYDGRPSFHTKEFVQKWGLATPPVAGNFFLAEYDPTSLKVHRQLGLIP